MPNKNYIRGYVAERKAQKILEKAGYITARTAGSHSPFDVIAICPNGVRLIQVKRVKEQNSINFALEEGKEEMLLCPKVPNITLEVWIYRDRDGFVIQEVVD